MISLTFALSLTGVTKCGYNSASELDDRFFGFASTLARAEGLYYDADATRTSSLTVTLVGALSNAIAEEVEDYVSLFSCLDFL